MKPTVVIPAHNEAGVISRGLHALLTHRSCNVIVVCNGCTDDTADVARFVLGVRVIETGVASKTHALNLGDEAAGDAFPRFYIDADVVVSAESLQTMATVLDGDEVLAVAPTVRHDLTGASWAVRAYYDVDSLLPSRKEGIGGSGVYALSKQGRQRFGPFPQITADDLFVRCHFSPHERETVAGAFAIVTVPRHLRELIAIQTRAHYGNYELEMMFPHLAGNRGQSNRGELLRLLARPTLWTRLAVYGFVKVAARFRAQRRLRLGRHTWERDASSRVAAANA